MKIVALLLVLLTSVPVLAQSGYVFPQAIFPTPAALARSRVKPLATKPTVVVPVATNTLSGVVVRWTDAHTVQVRTRRTRSVWVNDGATQTRVPRRSSGLARIGGFTGSSLPLGPSYDTVRTTHGHNETQSYETEVTVSGLVTGTVRAGDQINWKVLWMDYGSSRGHLLPGVRSNR